MANYQLLRTRHFGLKKENQSNGLLLIIQPIKPDSIRNRGNPSSVLRPSAMDDFNRFQISWIDPCIQLTSPLDLFQNRTPIQFQFN